MLYSKNPNLYLPDYWPTYNSKAKGCYIWDLNKKKYCDLSTMGVGTNILGYARNEIDNAVINVIKKSNMSSLNCLEEVKLAEKLIDNNHWSKMIKFSRTGGEANSVAIRIARAATGKNKIAICGYHGWHDWYLAANLVNKNKLNKLWSVHIGELYNPEQNIIKDHLINYFDEYIKKNPNSRKSTENYKLYESTYNLHAEGNEYFKNSHDK